jgi:hypothetical protein
VQRAEKKKEGKRVKGNVMSNTMKNVMRNAMKNVMRAAAILLLLCTAVGCSSDNAEEAGGPEEIAGAAFFQGPEGSIQVNEFMNIMRRTEGKVSPDSASETAATIEEGTLIFAISEVTEGWYEITHVGQKMFVPKSALQSQIVDENLALEVQDMEKENAMIIEAVERARASLRQARIWGVVIILFIVGIFALGIISTIKNSRAEKAEKEGQGDADGQDGARQAGLEWIDLDRSEDKE